MRVYKQGDRDYKGEQQPVEYYICKCAFILDGQVYSVDIYPNGRYIATGGISDSNGLVTIWENTTRLCERKLLGACQNCVRWSQDGEWLVAAGDSPAIHMYSVRVDELNTTITLQDSHTLIGHRMMVLHIAISRDVRYLASCSLDGTAIIHDMRALGSAPVAVLDAARNGHTESVTGAAWDPAERYLVTQSSDRSIKFWRLGTWNCEQTIDAIADKTVPFTRLDWTADGQFLIVPCANNANEHTAKLVARKTFAPEADLVGFEGSVACVKCSNFCIRYKNAAGKTQITTCVAVGASDHSLSLWVVPGPSRPLFVIKNFASGAIVDISWRHNTIVVASVDSSVRLIEFDVDEIGVYLSNGEMADRMKQLYHVVPSSFLVDSPFSTDAAHMSRKRIHSQNALRVVEVSDALRADAHRRHPALDDDDDEL